MEGINEYGNEALEIQDGHPKEQDSEDGCVSETTLSVDKPTNIQNIDKCLLNEDEKLSDSLTVANLPEETVTCKNTLKSFDVSKGSNPTETNGVSESHHTSVDEVICSDINKPTNSVPSYAAPHKDIRKRHVSNMETSKQSTSEQEFVIHHEYCENIESCEDLAKSDSRKITNVDDCEAVDSSKFPPQDSKTGLYDYTQVEWFLK